MDFEKKNRAYKSVMLVIVTALITFLITAIGMYNYVTKTDAGITKVVTSSEPTKLDTKLRLIRKYLEENYLGDIASDEELTESAIKGYVEGLKDEYTEYLTKDEYDELMVSVNGNYVGIGIYMTQDRYENIVVLLPIEKLKASVYQPRKAFNEESLNELASSIKEHGLLEPLLVKKSQDEMYEIICGERRFRACKIVVLDS